MGIGLVFGAGIGVAMDNIGAGMGVGIALGVAIGVAIGSAMEAKAKKEGEIKSLKKQIQADKIWKTGDKKMKKEMNTKAKIGGLLLM